MIIVKKFGGTSLGSYKLIKKLSKKIAFWIKNNKEKKLVVVVSAMAGVTDFLSKLSKISNSNKREKDVLLTCGEQISSALLCSFLNLEGCDSVSLQAWQVPILIKKNCINFLCKKKILSYLKKKKTVIISGFQGINKYNKVTTLERGGSDTTAVVLCKYLKAKKCYIYTDVNGIYQCDPRSLKSRKSKYIGNTIILEIASMGAKVLALESIRYCLKHMIKLIVLSSFNNNFTKKSGTIINQKNKIMNYFTKQDVFLLKIKENKLREIIENKIEIDLIKICNKKIFFTVKDYNIVKNVSYLKIYKNITKVSFVGFKIRENLNFTKIINFFIKYSFKKIINSTEIKISFIVKNKNIKKCLIFFKKNLK